MGAFEHIPVMVTEVVELFADVPPGVIVDATLGGGGHAEALLTARADVHLVGLDRDRDAIEAATRRLAPFAERLTVRHTRFDRLSVVMSEISNARNAAGLPELPVSGVLMDLGVSSPQLDRAERGFSFHNDGPLDMRMDDTQQLTAAQVVNEYDEAQLIDVLSSYGDERYARRIAKAIVAARPFETTAQLASVVRDAIPAPARRQGGHPARRTFQALRIEVNDELDALSDALDQAIDLLTPGGRCVVLAYHSGEDRIVKQRFRRAATGGCVCPSGLPCVCGAVAEARLIARGGRKASASELQVNRRAESVRLRALEKLAG